MVLSEGKGVGAGKQSSMPSSGLPGQTASFSHSHSCPCRQTHPFHSGPWASPYVHSGGCGATVLSPQAPGPCLGRLGIASGWRLMEREEGSARFLRTDAEVVCQSSLRHQNTTRSLLSSHLPISGVCCLTVLLPHPAEKLPCQATGLHPKSRPLFDPRTAGAAADVMLGSLRGKSPSHSPEP